MRIASGRSAGWRIVVAGAALAAAFPGGAHGMAPSAGSRASDCASRMAAARAKLSAERQAQLQGASGDDPPPMELRPAVLACFTDLVVPKLKAAEQDDEMIEPAFQEATRWSRESQLLGFGDEEFADEWRVVFASLTRGFTNGYAKAKARCRTGADAAAARKLRWLFASSTVIPGGGEELFPTFQEDVAKCLRGVTYLVTVEERTVSAKLGTTNSIRYVATVAPAPGKPDELEGTGSYSGFAVSTPNCDAQTGKWLGTPYRLPLAGKLSAWAQVVDLSIIGGSANTFQFVLGTLDWPYKPFFVSRQDAVAVGEDREAVAGIGTIAGVDVVLTGAKTTHRSTETEDGGACKGKVTSTTSVEVVRLGGR